MDEWRQPELAVFVGEPGRPSQLCKYLLAPLADGTATEADRAALLVHTDSCSYCRAELNAHYREDGENGGAA
jgi:hypothetical protein